MVILVVHMCVRAPAFRGPQPLDPSNHSVGQYLTFRLGREQFVLPTSRVQEVMGVGPITVVPWAPHYLKGLIPVQGRLVPVLDLRMRLGSAEPKYTPRTHLLVVQTGDPTRKKLTIAMIVDWISCVVPLRSNAIHGGIAKVNGKAKRLMDLDHLLSDEERQIVEGVVSRWEGNVGRALSRAGQTGSFVLDDGRNENVRARSA